MNFSGRSKQKIAGGNKNSGWIKIIFFAFEFRSAIYQKSTLEFQNKHCDKSNIKGVWKWKRIAAQKKGRIKLFNIRHFVQYLGQLTVF